MYLLHGVALSVWALLQRSREAYCHQSDWAGGRAQSLIRLGWRQGSVINQIGLEAGLSHQSDWAGGRAQSSIRLGWRQGSVINQIGLEAGLRHQVTCIHFVVLLLFFLDTRAPPKVDITQLRRYPHVFTTIKATIPLVTLNNVTLQGHKI